MPRLIDIFIPYWGDFFLAKEAVDSVINQTSKNWRLIIADDCYPSQELQKYCKQLNHPQVTYIRHKKNKGITNNFNFCIDKAGSEYCVIMGCDDRLLPNFVETALGNIRSADFYQPNVEVINANGKVYLPLADRIKRMLRPKKTGTYSGEKLAASLCRGNWLYFPSIVWKTETLKKYRFDPKYKIAEDVVVELNMILEGASLYIDNSTTFQYRRFAESLSSKEKSKNGVRFQEESEVYNHFAKKFRDVGWYKAARSAKIRITSRLHQLLAN